MAAAVSRLLSVLVSLTSAQISHAAPTLPALHSQPAAAALPVYPFLPRRAGAWLVEMVWSGGYSYQVKSGAINSRGNMRYLAMPGGGCFTQLPDSRVQYLDRQVSSLNVSMLKPSYQRADDNGCCDRFSYHFTLYRRLEHGQISKTATEWLDGHDAFPSALEALTDAVYEQMSEEYCEAAERFGKQIQAVATGRLDPKPLRVEYCDIEANPLGRQWILQGTGELSVGGPGRAAQLLRRISARAVRTFVAELGRQRAWRQSSFPPHGERDDLHATLTITYGGAEVTTWAPVDRLLPHRGIGAVAKLLKGLAASKDVGPRGSCL